MESQAPFESFADFYPFYLAEHAHPVSRRLDFAGSSVALVLLGTALATQEPWLILLALVQGYAFALVGHFRLEHHRPPEADFLLNHHPWMYVQLEFLPLHPSD